MKCYQLILVLLTAHLLASGAELPPDIEELKESLENKVSIGSINDNTIKNEAGEKIEVIRFYTRRDEDCESRFRMRVTVELEDKEGNTYFASLTQPHRGSGRDFTGEEKWEFQIPHKELNKPKISAYALQSGVIHNGKFIPITEELDDVDSEEEIRDRTTARIDMTCSYHHAEYWDR